MMEIEKLAKKRHVFKCNSKELSERTELIEKLIKYMESHVKREFVPAGSFNKEEYWNNEITCDCGKKFWSQEQKYHNSNKFPERYLDLWQWYLYIHICYEIRMKASVVHMDILRKILGDEITIRLLNHWGEKNILLGIAIKDYAEKIIRADKIKIEKGRRL